MFGLSNRRGKRAAGPIAATAAVAPMAAQQEAQPPPPHAQSSDAQSSHAQSPHAQSPHANLLQRWMSLAAMQQRVIETLAAEITRTSDFVETEADQLSQRFQRLAGNAQQQTARVDSLTSLAMGIDVDGHTVRIDQVAEMFEGTLGEVVAKILLLSKDSMSMVYALDALGSSVQNVGKCNAGIDVINSTLNMLALNARIEGERAGTAGAAFRVVANEVYELSKSTQTLAATMKTELKAMTDGIMNSHERLKRVATVDLSDNILVKERLDALLKALVDRNGHLQTVVAEAVTESELISADVAGMVTGIQFQDRTKQRLEHVVDTLHVINQALEEIKSSTAMEMPELAGEPSGDMDWVKHLLSRFTMSEMRERFVAQILDGQQVEWTGDPAEQGAAAPSGSMELF
jgi:methyl-accepting chemotaxis protein